MKIVIEPFALNTINEIAEFIDGINTPGAGDRWADRIFDFIDEYAQPKAHYSLCSNQYLAAKQLCCITFNNWVIVFTSTDKHFVVHQVIHGSLLI